MSMFHLDYKLAYVHIPKTGGTSIEAVLSATPGRIIRMGPHDTADTMSRWLLDVWAGCLTFTFVRNPWDRMVFIFFAYPYSLEYTSFHEFVLDWEKWWPTTQHKGQWGYVCDNNGIVKVGFVGRFSRLQQDFNTICERSGAPVVELPHKLAGRHAPYWQYYTKETMKIIGKLYAKDIEIFKYTFPVDGLRVEHTQ